MVVFEIGRKILRRFLTELLKDRGREWFNVPHLCEGMGCCSFEER